MKEQVMQVLCWTLAAFTVCLMAYTIRWNWRKRKWGCSRCAYLKTIETMNGPRTGCTASCGNNEGRTCPAWCYRDPEEDESVCV